MNTLYTFINHGRYLVRCPKCGGYSVVQPGKEFICTGCYPELLKNSLLHEISPGVFRPMPDIVERERQREEARKTGRAYQVVIPDNKIMRVLQKRREEHQNWYPKELPEVAIEHGCPPELIGQNIESLELENQALGV